MWRRRIGVLDRGVLDRGVFFILGCEEEERQRQEEDQVLEAASSRQTRRQTLASFHAAPVYKYTVAATANLEEQLLEASQRARRKFNSRFFAGKDG